MLGVPMLREGVPIGTIVVAWPDPGETPDRQVELLQTFANQAVIAIENVRLFQELQARTRELARSVEELQSAGRGRPRRELESGSREGAHHHRRTRARARGSQRRNDLGVRRSDPAVPPSDRLRGGGRAGGAHSRGADPARGRHHRKGRGNPRARPSGRHPGRGSVRRRPRPQRHDATRIPLRSSPCRSSAKNASSGALAVWRRQVASFPPDVVNLLQTFATQSTLAIQHARLFRELEEKSRELELASRHKSEFLANMSHELRTPLNAVLGYTELILDSIYGEVPEKIRDVMARIDKSGRHLLGLINDILDLSKIEAGQLALSLADYSMKELVQTVFAAVESLAAEKKLALKVDVAADLPRGRGDERRLSQVLLNLVGNALKFTEAGEVRVKAGLKDGDFIVSVADTGPGISASDQERIFEAFQQVDTSLTRRKGGTGLGLSIARRIVELHGGRLWVESAPGKGSTFSFTVPVRVERQVTP